MIENAIKKQGLDIGFDECQVTFGTQGHFLHDFHAFSPDNKCLVYDGRNDDTHIGRTGNIEMVCIKTGEIKTLYTTKNQTIYGPGVGAVSFNPKQNKVLFIHGLENCSREKPYGFTRRTGVVVEIDSPQKKRHLDARNVMAPFTKGALRGGTHAHTWSPDGHWISFTYNDDLMAKLEESSSGEMKDLRMVGIMAPIKSVKVPKDGNSENVDGEMYTIIISKVTDKPQAGTDEINRAHSDAWVGERGYQNSNGEKQNRAVAFLGDIRGEGGESISEVFIVDLPNDLTQSKVNFPIEGTSMLRPQPPLGVIQRRISYTLSRKYPGVQGPRQAIKSTPDGSFIYVFMKDILGVVQIFSLRVKDGELRQVTNNLVSIDTAFSLSPDGKFLAYGINEEIFITEIESGEIKKIATRMENTSALGSINWSNDGEMIAFNRKVRQNEMDFYQIFVLKRRAHLGM